MISELVKEAQGSALPQYAAVAQAVERFLGKEEVTSSILVNSSTFCTKTLFNHFINRKNSYG